MTPAARASAAIEILDRIQAVAPAEAVLTTWARGNRYAGSGDRAAIRDLVYDVLRRRSSCAIRGGGTTGRALLIGHCRAQGIDLNSIFTGERFAPAPLTGPEAAGGAMPSGADALDVPAWLAPDLMHSLGADYAPVMAAQQMRAPVFLRVNLRKASTDDAIAALAREGIVAQPHPLVKTSLEVTENARKIQNSTAYGSGLVELQDASSQAAIASLPLRDGMRVLDYCAGGGGKVLAMAALAEGRYFAHDIDAGRMRDLPARAARAGAKVTILPPGTASGRYDLVLVDAPCSGSGTWRRTPDAKWRLTRDRLNELIGVQREILEQAAALLAPGGVLAYMTCSLLKAENIAQVEWVAQRFSCTLRHAARFLPPDGGDGFFVACLDAPAP